MDGITDGRDTALADNLNHLFFEDGVTSRVNAELNLLAALRDSRDHHVALRTAGLSPESVQSISEVIGRGRVLEGLPRVPRTDDA
ncbi:hypothetical protein AB0C81_04925 [Streptomyces roseoverticillatus]|uniref:hypothetical protein n=1 Tax=Streptomyces roseoverticillatus TaxID=66429 RepID=UPI0033E5D857